MHTYSEQLNQAHKFALRVASASGYKYSRIFCQICCDTCHHSAHKGDV